MFDMAYAAGAFCLVAVALHVTVAAIAASRCRQGAHFRAAASSLPAVSIVRPMCGVDAYEQSTLRSAFELDYPNYELLLCCACANDPVVPLARRMIEAYPNVRARLLIGDDVISDNPKLNNTVKGWQAAAHDWIVMADSNVLMPRDYLQALLATWGEDTGLVCAPPVGVLPGNFAAELECAFLNGYQASWQYAADRFGLGFAQGKTMLWHRDVLERAGGITVLGREAAEDAAATKLVRNQGRRVRLCNRPSLQPLGARTIAHVWARQLRWARLRLASFPLFFLPEVLTGSLPPILTGMVAAPTFDLDAAAVAVGVTVVWYGAEAWVARTAGWPLSWRSPLAWALRDALLPLLWAQSWLSRSITWRGNEMRAVRAT
jgi:ceramide glucosyltransferase